MIDGVAAVQSVKPKETYVEWFNMLSLLVIYKFITAPNEAEALSIDVEMDTYLAKKV